MSKKMDLSSSDQIIQLRIKNVLPHLDERQSRLYLGAEALSLSWGGKSKISLLSGICRAAIARGVDELEQVELEKNREKEKEQDKEQSRIRKKGGGRKKITVTYPNLLHDINEIVGARTMGDPCNPLIWCSKNLRKIKHALQRDKGYAISHEAVRQAMLGLGYSLQSNKKTKEGGDHPDRDAQFEHINGLAK